MKHLTLVLALVLGILVAAYVVIRQVTSSGVGGHQPSIATSVDYIHQIGELSVLRASVKEIVTTRIGESSWFRSTGKLAIICHFDLKYKYDLRKAKIDAGVGDNGERYCVIGLPRHEFEVATKAIQFYDEQDGTWLGLPQKTSPDERTRALDAARLQAEKQAKEFLGDMEAEIQNSARTTLGQVARALGFSDVRFQFAQ